MRVFTAWWYPWKRPPPPWRGRQELARGVCNGHQSTCPIFQKSAKFGSLGWKWQIMQFERTFIWFHCGHFFSCPSCVSYHHYQHIHSSSSNILPRHFSIRRQTSMHFTVEFPFFHLLLPIKASKGLSWWIGRNWNGHQSTSQKLQNLEVFEKSSFKLLTLRWHAWSGSYLQNWQKKASGSGQRPKKAGKRHSKGWKKRIERPWPENTWFPYYFHWISWEFAGFQLFLSHSASAHPRELFAVQMVLLTCWYCI